MAYVSDESSPETRRQELNSDFTVAKEEIQLFINSFTYNMSGNLHYRPKQTRGTLHLVEVFEEVKAKGLPIQCVEAVFIGAVLSAPYLDVLRIPISFESKCNGNIYKHIILATQFAGYWGALGISRRDCLMNKPLGYHSLWQLIEEYERSYQSVDHELLAAYCGNPLPHNLDVGSPLVWKALKLRIGVKFAMVSRRQLDQFLERCISKTLPRSISRQKSQLSSKAIPVSTKSRTTSRGSVSLRRKSVSRQDFV
jgi:hypothetical protein